MMDTITTETPPLHPPRMLAFCVIMIAVGGVFAGGFVGAQYMLHQAGISTAPNWLFMLGVLLGLGTATSLGLFFDAVDRVTAASLDKYLRGAASRDLKADPEQPGEYVLDVRERDILIMALAAVACCSVASGGLAGGILWFAQ